jgi:hypothetical protein
MIKFNLHNEIIVASRAELFKAINSTKQFAISITGTVHYEPFSSDEIYIYQGCVPALASSALAMPKARSLQDLLGNAYKIVEDDERVLIKAAGAWSDIINYNKNSADYDDTSGDGIGDFSDQKLEDIGWHATEFNITYRELAEHIEAHCDGILLCVEIQEPYQFSGLGFIKDRPCARETLFSYCQEKVAYALSHDPDFKVETLNDDELEAAEFFKVL